MAGRWAATDGGIGGDGRASATLLYSPRPAGPSTPVGAPAPLGRDGPDGGEGRGHRGEFAVNEQEGAWQQFAREIGGEYVDGAVRSRVGGWTVTLDTYMRIIAYAEGPVTEVPVTRLEARFVTQDTFRFFVGRQGFFQRVAKLFGMQDVTVGHPEFDDAFVIKGKDEAKVRTFFKDGSIRDLLQVAMPASTAQFSVLDNAIGPRREQKPTPVTEGVSPDFTRSVPDERLPRDVDLLHFTDSELITDVERLKALHELFSKTLHRLVELGSAAPEAPGPEA